MTHIMTRLGQGSLSFRRDRVDVHDQGPGIPEQEREKIVDMFYTVRQGNRLAAHPR